MFSFCFVLFHLSDSRPHNRRVNNHTLCWSWGFYHVSHTLVTDIRSDNFKKNKQTEILEGNKYLRPQECHIRCHAQSSKSCLLSPRLIPRFWWTWQARLDTNFLTNGRVPALRSFSRGILDAGRVIFGYWVCKLDLKSSQGRKRKDFLIPK